MFIDEVGSHDRYSQNSLHLEREGRLGDKTVWLIKENHLQSSLPTWTEQYDLQTSARMIRSMGVQGSVEGGVNVRWGGEDGVKVGGYFEGEVSDDNGNYAKGQIRQNNDGSGEANISAGHRKEK